MAFVHLRAHTEYSVVDGTLRIDDAIEAAAKDRQGALAITDLSNLFGAVKFYSAARRLGVKPIIGADLWLDPEIGDKAPSRMVVLAQDRQGYLNLCELLSRSWLHTRQRGQAWVRWEWLEDLNRVGTEEPRDAHDPAGHADLARALDTPIATVAMRASVAVL